MSSYLKWKPSSRAKGSISPSSRQGHSFTCIPSKGIIIMFGGCSNNKNNELFVYSITENMWVKQAYKGITPSPRCYHQAVYCEELESLIVVGGYTSLNISVNDIFFLFLENWTWKVFKSSEGFPQRHHFSMVKYKQSLVIFGGITRPNQSYLNDTWKVKLNQCEFSLDNYAHKIKISEICTSGRCPSKRYGAQSLLIKNQLMIFGGQTKSDESDEFIYFLCLETKSWSSFKPVLNAIMLSRAFSTMIQLPESRIAVFGGTRTRRQYQIDDLMIIDLKSLTIAIPFVAGVRPQTRCYMGGCQVGNDMYVVGGLNSKYCSMDLICLQYCLSSMEQQWQQLKPPSDFQLRAFNIVSSQIVSNHHQILSIEWAIRQETKLKLMLQTIAIQQIAKNKEEQVRLEEKRLKKIQAENCEKQRIENFQKDQKICGEMLELEKKYKELIGESVTWQQKHLLYTLNYIQFLENHKVDNSGFKKAVYSTLNKMLSIYEQIDNIVYES